MGLWSALRDYIFYRADRVGKDGVIFKLYKFRSMVKGADRLGPVSVSGDDKRVTLVGRFLRKWHIDELPNLINVAKGDMVLIGPRPEVKHYIDKLTAEQRKIVLSVKPGCLDPATLWNLNEGERLKGQEDPEAYYEREIWPQKVKMQIDYILKRS